MINPYVKFKDYSTELAHCYFVFEDQEFKDLIIEYKDKILSHDFYLDAVDELAQEFLEKFDLPPYALDDYLESNFIDKYEHPHLTLVSEDPRVKSFRTAEISAGTNPGMKSKNGEKWITIHFNENDFSFEQYRLAWPFIKGRLREEGYTAPINKQPKRSSPENTQLLYAIFKARKQGKTFTEIYQLYSNRTLEYYVGKKPTHTTIKSFQNYYYRHY
jgi:hypothetical protein